MNPLLVTGAIIALVALIASRRREAGKGTTTPILPEEGLTGPADAPELIINEPDIITRTPEGPSVLVPGVDAATQRDIEAELDKERVKLPKKFPSPFERVKDDAWTKYVTMQRSGKLNSITPGFALGIWGLGMRVLQDLGYAKNVKLQPALDGRQVFKGDFIPPYTQDRFLSDAQLQYEAFRRMTQSHAKYINAHYANQLANIPDVTLSGYLALAKHAGLAGMDRWMKDPATRKESTTAVFNKFNKLF